MKSMVSSDKEQTNQQKTMLKENKQLQRQINNNHWSGLRGKEKQTKIPRTKNKQTNNQC